LVYSFTFRKRFQREAVGWKTWSKCPSTLDLLGPLGKDAYRIRESATRPGLRAGKDEKVNSLKGLSRPRGMLLFLRKSSWHARLAMVDNRRLEPQQEGGQVTSE